MFHCVFVVGDFNHLLPVFLVEETYSSRFTGRQRNQPVADDLSFVFMPCRFDNSGTSSGLYGRADGPVRRESARCALPCQEKL